MKMDSKQIPLLSIDPGDATFQIRSRGPNRPRGGSKSSGPDLARSIRRAGLLHPPLVQAKDGGHYRVVCGFARVQALRHLSRKNIPALVASPGASFQSLAVQAVAEAAFSGELAPMEQARAFALLSRDREPSQAKELAVDLLGLPPNPDYLEKLEHLTRLPQALQTAMEDNVLGMAMALELGKLSAKDSQSLAGLFTRVPMSLSKQREMVKNLTELAARDGKSVSDLLEQGEFHHILADSNLDKNRKIALLRKHLQQKRYPNLVRAQKDFDALVKQLNLPQGMDWEPPAFFESPVHVLKLRFKSDDQLMQYQDVIKRLLDGTLATRLLNFAFKSKG